MIVKCARCGEVQGEKEPLEDISVSHVICEPCREKTKVTRIPKMLSRAETEELLLDKKCPDCHGEKLLGGPIGVGSNNIKCEGCGSEFSIFPPFFAERIGG